MKIKYNVKLAVTQCLYLNILFLKRPNAPWPLTRQAGPGWAEKNPASEQV